MGPIANHLGSLRTLRLCVEWIDNSNDWIKENGNG